LDEVAWLRRGTAMGIVRLRGRDVWRLSTCEDASINEIRHKIEIALEAGVKSARFDG
jgi:hypothetical protein